MRKTLLGEKTGILAGQDLSKNLLPWLLGMLSEYSRSAIIMKYGCNFGLQCTWADIQRGPRPGAGIRTALLKRQASKVDCECVGN